MILRVCVCGGGGGEVVFVYTYACMYVCKYVCMCVFSGDGAGGRMGCDKGPLL